MSFTSRLIPALPIAAMLLAGVARAETRTSVVLGAEGGYGSNPFLGSGDDEQSASIILSAAPTVSLIGPTSKIDLYGQAEQAFFTSRFGDYTNWALGANAGVQLSPLSDLSLGAAYSSHITSGLNSVIAPPTNDGSIPPPDPSATEIAGQRSKTLSGSGSFSTRVSLRDTVSVSANASKVDYSANLNSDYTNYGSSLGVMHIFSDKLSAGFSIGYSKTDYQSATLGTFQSYSPSANATLKLAARTSLAVSLGASFSKISGPGASPTKPYFSGSANLCRKGDRSNLCLIAARSVGATAQAGSSTITQLGANYSYVLTPRSSFALGGNYSATQSIGLGTNNDTSYANAYASYSHQLTQRLSFVVNTRYTDPLTSIGARGQSFYGGAGVTYRLGR